MILTAKIRRTFIGLLAMSLLLQTGCAIIRSPESYMRLPGLTIEQESLKEAMEQARPEGAVAVFPRTPSSYGTVPMTDLDGDGSKEAVAFYKEKTSGAIKGEIWSKDAGISPGSDSWRRQAVLEGDGTFLEEIQFQDVTNDNRIDIIVGYSLGNQQQKGLTLYSQPEPGAGWSPAAKLPYSLWGAGDLNGDGKQDLSVVSGKRETGFSFELYQYDGKLDKLGSVSLGNDSNAFYSMKVGGVTAAGRQGAVLDASIGAHSSYTSLVVYEQGGLSLPLATSLTYKAYSGLSEDIDGDGIIEISGMREPLGMGQTAMVNMPWIYQYFRWDGAGGLTPILEQYINMRHGYTLQIPPEWNKSFTIDQNDANETRFLTYPGERKLLAAVRMFPLAQWTGDTPEWVEVRRTTDAVIVIDREHMQVADKLRLNVEVEQERGGST
jgi:hypothetical protein